ncbi:response regulator [Massilia sp. TS11]|uniref:response regulator n=1 Tax=Massilia sp. TS11 TaxID=2908003 RepID=UPI001EDBABE0|nr:response regulator [Massilia sp. TS11]MCG2586214.1 response regulator [Massilia sp. TS11]
MLATAYPHAVRLLGFSPEDTDEIATVLADAPLPGAGYFCLSEDSLQEPDLVIANGADLQALALLAAAQPGPLLPAVVVGEASSLLAVPHLPLPVDPDELFALLDALMARRAQALAGGAAAPALPERRRRPRLDYDLTDPSEYLALRKAPPTGAVLLVDTDGQLREHIVPLLAPRRVSVEWTDSAALAVSLCEETPVALVLVNTATPGLDPYQLCAEIKATPKGLRIAVVLLAAADFTFDRERARSAGVRGYLDKPVSDRNLLALLQKMLSLGA